MTDPSASSESTQKLAARTCERLNLHFRRLEFAISIMASAAVVAALYYNIKTVESNSMAVRNSVSQNATSLTIRLDELFLAQPEFYEYFNEGKEPPNRNDPKLKAAANMVLDVLDVAESQTTTYREMWDSPEEWGNWVRDQFRKSPFLCDFLEARKD